MFFEVVFTLSPIFLAVSGSNIAEFIQGPSSRTTLVGPDGSILDSTARGGTVVTNTHGAALVAAEFDVMPLDHRLVVSGPTGSILSSHTPGAVYGISPGAATGIVAAPTIAAPADQDAFGEGADDSDVLHEDASHRWGN